MFDTKYAFYRVTRILISAAAAMAVVLAARCGLAADELVLVSPHWEGIKYEFERAFAEEYERDTGRKVDLKWLDLGGGASDIIRFVRSEYKNKPNGIGVDLFYGGGLAPYIELKKLGLLDPYKLPEEILSKVAKDVSGSPVYDAEDFSWYAPTMAGFGIVYNKVVMAKLGLPVPKTWADLAAPEYYSWVGSADPRKSGSAHMAYEIILQAYGWEDGWRIITAVGANIRGFSAGASQTPKDVAVGEVACGLAIDSYAWNQVRESGADVIGFALPDDLTVVNGDAIAILRGAPNRDIARAFVRFCMSEAGQRLWLLRAGEPGGPVKFEIGKFSVMPHLYDEVRGRTSVSVDPFTWKSAFRYDADKGSVRYGIVNDLIGSQVIEPKERLASVWRKAIREGRAADELGRLSAMPVTEAEAMELVRSGQWGDAGVRNRALAEWNAFARQKYGSEDLRLKQVLRNLPAALALLFGAALFIYIRRHGRA